MISNVIPHSAFCLLPSAFSLLPSYFVPLSPPINIPEKNYLCLYPVLQILMTDLSIQTERFRSLQCCVIIPTYNNDQTLEKVIHDVLEYTGQIIVVNDGSTDNTAQILDQFTQIDVVSCEKNQGKGHALALGFRYAIEKGYRYAITIDSDGQHYADDLPAFLDKVEQQPGCLVMGARNMDQHSVPGTSSFGHKFSIFWFRVETGQKIGDVQSGYRLYPLEPLKKMKFFGKKYEFEVEVLVRLLWKGVDIYSIPVKVWYAPKETRVSHFRKFRDFTRVSIVNSILVFIALLWVNPFKFLKALRKTSVRKFYRDYIINSGDSNAKVTWSVMLGVFLGVIPIWGFQMLVAFSTAYFLKLNRFVTVAASNISIPPMLPFILFLSYYTGGILLGTTNEVHYSAGFTYEWVKDNIVQYLLGSIVFAFLLSLLLGIITFLLLRIFRKPKAVVTEDSTQNQV